MKTLELKRQEAEELVDLLEEQPPDRMLHDQSCREMAAEIRRMFGMRPQDNGKFVEP